MEKKLRKAIQHGKEAAKFKRVSRDKDKELKTVKQELGMYKQQNEELRIRTEELQRKLMAGGGAPGP
jgi:hypothetical protein